MNEKNDAFMMRPGDTFVADECGCSFTVESGPRDEHMAKQAPTCCCGHKMHKESFGSAGQDGLQTMRGESDAVMEAGRNL